MRIYIAAPYSKGDTALNIREVIFAAEHLIKLGHNPYVPHLTHLWHLISPHKIEFWYDYDLKWLDACDAVLRLPGESSGADREVEVAQNRGKPVYYAAIDVPRAKTNQDRIRSEVP